MPEIRANHTFSGGAKVTGLPAPTVDADAATKAYVDALSAGRDWKESVRAASTGNLVLVGTQTVDGVALVAGDRALVKDQTVGTENGIYVVAAGAWARAADADTSADLNAGATISVEEGTVNGDTRWVLTTNAPITLGSTSLTFTKDAGETVVAGAGLTKTGSTLNVGAGTGIIVNADDIAIDPAVVVRKYAVALAGGATSEVVTHNLNTRDVIVQVYQGSSPYDEEMFDIERTGLNTVTIRSVANLPAGYRVVVLG